MTHPSPIPTKAYSANPKGPLISPGLGRVLVFLGFWIFALMTRRGNDIVPITLPLLIIILSQVARIQDKSFVPLDMFWLCIHLFFVMAPIQTYVDGVFVGGPAGNCLFQNSDVVRSAAVVVIAAIFFVVGLSLAKATSPKTTRRLAKIRSTVVNHKHIVLLLILGFVCFLCFVQMGGGLTNVLLPRREKDYTDANPFAPVVLGLQAVAALIIAISIRFNPSKKKQAFGVTAFLIAAFFLFISANPFNASRFFWIGTWVPILFVFGSKYTKYLNIYAFLVVALVVIIPISSLTSRRGLAGFGLYQSSGYSEDVFHLKDIDVFDVLTYGVQMTDRTAFYWGQNTAAAVSFFVPRFMWEDKPFVGGLIVGNELHDIYGAGTPNLSYFLGGDFYMDFGYLGVAIGFILMGYLFEKLYRMEILFNGVNVIPPIMSASLPILIRGPFGAVSGYFFCLVAAAVFYKKVLK